MTSKKFDDEYQDAVQAAAVADAFEPRAKSARYDRRTHRIVVELTNGATFLFPPELAQGLAGATAKDLAQIEVSPSGSGLHWPSLDADFSLPGLILGRFGTKTWMAELARRSGRTRLTMKPASAHVREKKAGRSARS
jgi:hypothetical protein